MKITVSKSELFGKLKSMGRIIQPKNSLPAYDNFLFQLIDNSQLQVTAGEEGGRISTRVACKSDAPIEPFMIHAKTLLDGLKEIPEQPLIINIKTVDNRVEVKVSYSNGNFSIAGTSGKEYPEIANEVADNPFALSGDAFLYGVRQVQICCANDELRPTINGVFIEKGADAITYVASDGSTLGMVSYPSVDTENSSFILPTKFAKLISNIIAPGCEALTVTVGSPMSSLNLIPSD